MYLALVESKLNTHKCVIGMQRVNADQRRVLGMLNADQRIGLKITYLHQKRYEDKQCRKMTV